MIQDATLGGETVQAPINFSGSGDNTIIAGVFGKLFKVQQMFFVLGGASNLVFKSGSIAISGTLTMSAGGSFFMDYIHLPLTGISQGDAFIINSSNAVVIGGTLWYIQSP